MPLLNTFKSTRDRTITMTQAVMSGETGIAAEKCIEVICALEPSIKNFPTAEEIKGALEKSFELHQTDLLMIKVRYESDLRIVMVYTAKILSTGCLGTYHNVKAFNIQKG